MSNITVKQIASDLNLSIGTVYRSLNGTGRVSEKTRRLVIEYADSMGFKSNTVAQGLARRKNYHIVITIGDKPAKWWDSVLEGVEIAASELSEFGVKVSILRFSYAKETGPIGLLSLLKNEKVDGIILIPSPRNEIVKSIDYAVSHNIPIASINGDFQLKSKRLFYYGPDEDNAGGLAAELIGKFLNGTGNVLILGTDSSDNYRFAHREKGFFYTLYHDYPNIKVTDTLSFPHDNVSEHLKNYLSYSGHTPDAIYVTSATALSQVGNTLRELNLKGIRVVGHECLNNADSLLKDGWISALLCQETYAQGYNPIKLMYYHLLNGFVPDSFYFCNVNIIMKGNVALLSQNENGCGLK